jgi:hypothetical protein
MVRDREHISKLYQSFLKSIEQNEWYGDDHPYFIILQHIDGRMEHLKTKLSDKKFETLEMLLGLAQKIIDSPTPDDEYDAEETIKAFVLEHLVDLNEERYKEEITDAKRSGKFITMGDYVVDKIEASLKCGLRDILTQYDYQGKVQPDKVRQLLKQIDVALEVNDFKNTAKGGSGPAETRCKDNKFYPDKVYNRSAVVKLNVEVSREERASMERIAITYLVLTTGGNCANCQLVIKDSTFDGGVYIMFSKYETIDEHFTAFGRQDRGIILPKGAKIVVDTPTSTAEKDNIDSNNTETEAAAPTAAAGGGGGGGGGGVVDENSLVLAGDEHLESPPETTHGSGDLKLAARPGVAVADQLLSPVYGLSGLSTECLRSIDNNKDKEINAGDKSRGESPNNVMDVTEFQQSGQSSNILHSFDNEADDWNVYDDDSMSRKRKNSSNELTHANLEAIQAITAKNRAQEGLAKAQLRSHFKHQLRDEQRNQKKAKKAVVDAYDGNEDMANEKIEQFQNSKEGSEEEEKKKVMQFSQDEVLTEHYDACCEVCYYDAQLKKLDNTN